MCNLQIIVCSQDLAAKGYCPKRCKKKAVCFLSCLQVLWYGEQSRDKIELIVKMLEVIELLVAYGFYWTDLNGLLETVITILSKCIYVVVNCMGCYKFVLIPHF